MADPVTAVIAVVSWVAPSAGAAAAAWAAAAPIAVAALNLAASLAISSALAGPQPSYTDPGAQLEFQADPNAGIPIVFGRTCVAGTLALQYPSGPKNKHLNMIGVYSGCGPIGGIDQFEMSDVVSTWNNVTGKVNNGKFKDRMWYKTALGHPADAALTQPQMPATDSPLPQWTAAHRMRGFAQFWLDAEYDSEVWSTAIDPRVILRGVYTYDPRQDDTYPGGSGPMRANDCLTWGYSDCPIRASLSYYLGYFYLVDGKRRRMGGVGIPPSGIDMASFVEAMNVSDANGWKIGARITTLDPKWDTGKRLLKTASAEPVAVGGVLGVRIDAPRTSLVTITANDLAAPFSVPATKPRRDRINAIIPRYRSEAHNWEIVPGGIVSVASYQALDGGLRQREIEYPFCQDAKQAQQLAAYDLVNAREFGPIGLPCKPWLAGYRPGDSVTVHIPEAGLINQQVIIKARRIDPTGAIVTLTVESETAAKHPFALGQTENPPPTPGLAKPDFADVPAPEAGQWSAVGMSLAGPEATVPCITVTGSASDNPFVSEVIAEYRKVGVADWTMWGASPATTSKITLAGLGGSENYEVAIRYRSIYGVAGPRLILGPVLTPAGYGVASSIANQGGLAVRDDVVFGTPEIRETPGGSNATLSNFKTLLGIAAGFQNQGALAVLSTLDRLGGLLTGFGDLSGLSNLFFGSPLLLESNGGAAATLSGFKTSLGVAAAIANQTAWATLGAPVGRISGLTDDGFMEAAQVYKAGVAYLGNVWPAEAGANVTEARTAAAVYGQSAWATFSGLVPSNVAGQVQRLQTDGYMSSVNIFQSGVGWLNNVWPSEAGANVTESRVSAAVYGQTSWATYTGPIGSFASRNGIGLSEVGDRWAGYVTYGTGATVESLRPGEAGANVTEARTSAAVYGQGALATLSSLDLMGGRLTGFGYFAAFNQISLSTSYLTRADGSTQVTESLVVTNIGVAAAVYAQGELATQSNLRPGQVADPTQPGVPLRSVAATQLATSSDSIDTLFGDGFAFGAGPNGWDLANGNSSRFWNNRTDVDIAFRVRTGDVLFEVDGYATVEHHLTLWYSKNGAWPTFLAESIEPLGGSGTVPVSWTGYINMEPGDYITFFISPKMPDGNWYNGSNRFRLRNCRMKAKANNL